SPRGCARSDYRAPGLNRPSKTSSRSTCDRQARVPGDAAPDRAPTLHDEGAAPGAKDCYRSRFCEEHHAVLSVLEERGVFVERTTRPPTHASVGLVARECHAAGVVHVKHAQAVRQGVAQYLEECSAASFGVTASDSSLYRSPDGPEAT